MELLLQLKEWWFEYYPLVVGGLTAIGGAVAIGVTVWFQVKPYLDKITAIKDKISDTSGEDVNSLIKSTTLSTQITDLKAKIENPTVSDILKQEYITQLATLEVVKAKLDAGLVVAEEATSKF